MKKARYKFTILGCGSSPGVPRVNGDWGACDPRNKKNKRMRPAFLVERYDNNGNKTVIVIDTGPDFHDQMLLANVTHVDAVLYTHAHADHTHGIDDLRCFSFEQKKNIDIYAEKTTLKRLNESFGYCFNTPLGSNYPPILKANEITIGKEFTISGLGGDVPVLAMKQEHGSIFSTGYRINKVAYCTDVSNFPFETLPYLKNLDTLIVDCLQYKPHPSHLTMDQALEWIKKISPRRAIFTHMHIPLDYDTLRQQLPENIEPAYDGLSFIIED